MYVRQASLFISITCQPLVTGQQKIQDKNFGELDEFNLSFYI